MHDRDSDSIDDCWNRIGVRGDRSCPRLDEYIHCRQCPVHAAAAKTLLHRVVSDVDTRAGAPATSSIANGGAFLLIFRLHAEWLALPVAALAEVTAMRPIHSLPRRAGIVLGVCNVRGRLIPCISLAALLDLAPRQAEEDGKATPRMLVLSSHTGTIVAPVDDIAGIQPFTASSIGALPDTLAGARYASGVVRYRDRAVGLLDSARITQAIVGRLQ
ncbi:MAG TPA: chemotaxis protein CheW [Bordetella sp.]|jgi:chemotaxis-related protein WspD|nr:chemotaxis protein CheW [Bordetella sp.]